MNRPSPLDPGRLITLLQEQRDLYRQLGALSDRQRTMISGDRPELLLTILRERQNLVTALARLNEQLAPFRRQWDELYAQLPESQRGRASEILQEINGLLRGILRTDQEDSALLSARKQLIAGELATVTGGQTANSAYARRTPAGGSSGTADLTG